MNANPKLWIVIAASVGGLLVAYFAGADAGQAFMQSVVCGAS